MKRGLLAFMLPVFLFVFASCGDTYNEYIVDDDNPHMQTEIVNYTIEANHWVYEEDAIDGSNPYYVYEARNVDALTPYIYTYGTINIYMYLNASNYNGGYVPLSDAFPYEEFYNGDQYIWTIHYSYECYPDRIVFTAVNTDYDSTEYGDWHPGKRAFRIVLNWY